VIFVEVLRLILVLVGALGGLELGRTVNASPAPVVGMVLGALVSYVIGGALGRLLQRQQGWAVQPFSRIPPGELLAGTVTGIAGLALGVVLCLPLLVLVRSPLVYPAASAVAWVMACAGFRVGMVKGGQVAAAAGLSRILSPPTEPPPGFAVLVDASAVMDHSVLVLGRAGLLVGGLVVPRFVVDQVQALAAAPDPVTSRRARRGLEALEALREAGVVVKVAEDELPEIDDVGERLLETSRRLGLRLLTSSGQLRGAAPAHGVVVTDLRAVVEEMWPDHPAGERLTVELERAGRQPRQGTGFLADGNLVVVNDGAHLVGRGPVDVEVLSSRRTSQGLLLFARLAPDTVATVTSAPLPGP
jgi:uncharacterized protein YacL